MSVKEQPRERNIGDEDVNYRGYVIDLVVSSPGRTWGIEAKGKVWIDVKNRKDRLLRHVSMRVGWEPPAPVIDRRSGTGLDWTPVVSGSGVMT